MMKKQVATTGGKKTLPTYMEGKEGRGTENLSRKDYEMPIVTLLQGLSQPVIDGEAKAGNFFHTVADIEFDGSLRIVPIMIFTRYILWRPRHDGGGILARAEDGIHWEPPQGEFTVKPIKGSNKTATYKLFPTVAESGLDQWGTSDPDNPDSPPAATYGYYVIAWLPDFPEYSPVAIRLQRTSIKAGKKLASKLKISQAPSYGTQLIMSQIMETNDAGEKYFNYKFVMDGFVEDEDLFNRLEGLYETFKADGVKLKDEEQSQEADPEAEKVDEKKRKF